MTFSPGDLVSARGREWVAEPSPREGLLCLRPLSGAIDGRILIEPALESEAVRPARFCLPADAVETTQPLASLLADALRLSLRRGAGPFRSAAQIAFQPRTYQLVPLLMALRQPVPRLLIADDVGIGKTIEAGLILRELIDRGEVDGFSVLCPPHLVEQWTNELRDRFAIDATAVTSGSARRLERGLPVGQTLFDAHPQTIVSLDYIKAEKRRDIFARACPKFVIVDEAHASTGTGAGRQQRFALLSGLAADPERALILLTATPHSGNEAAFGRLLSLLSKDFETLDFGSQRFRESLARHYVQRGRRDLEKDGWEEGRVFPKHNTRDVAYPLDAAHLAFHEAILDYCFDVVAKAGSAQRQRRLAFWGTLALMRCVGSSPAAALSALRNRAASEAPDLDSQVYDEDGDDEDAFDIEPAPIAADDPKLGQLVAQAESLVAAPDPKIAALLKILKPLLAKGGRPVIFCRYVATAEHVARQIAGLKGYEVACVTGRLTPDDRRERVDALHAHDRRILVATDCLSEGINLQQLFDACIHYDLSWNPTRHQQREGRVNRFGQPAPEVHSVLMFSPDSAIDGAVLQVILKKADAIREATGVTVPLPEDRGPVTEALMAAILLREGRHRQLSLDLGLDESPEALDAHWRDAEAGESASRAIFAQNALKPAEVAPLWRDAAETIGGPDAAASFVRAAMRGFHGAAETDGARIIAHLDGLPLSLRQRLKARDIEGAQSLALTDPAPTGASVLTRAHPLVTTLAEATLEAALEPAVLADLGLGRTGACATRAVSARTTVVLLRLRFKLTVRARRTRLLLAEEAAVVAISGDSLLAGDAGRALLAAEASSDLAPSARARLIDRARADLPDLLSGALTAHAHARAQALALAHQSLRQAAGDGFSRVEVEPALPPDVIGLFVLVPEVAD